MNWRSATLALASVAFSLTKPDRDAEDIQDFIALRPPPLQEVQVAVAEADVLPFDRAAAQESRPPRCAAIIAAPFALEPLEVAVADEITDVDNAGWHPAVYPKSVAIPVGHVAVG